MEGLAHLLPLLLPTAAAQHPAELPALVGLTQQALLAALRQAVERIARMREAAAACLLALLPAAQAAGVPLAAELSHAVTGRPLEQFSSLEALPALAALVVHAPLQPALLEGLTFSIGGLDSQLATAAGNALAGAVEEQLQVRQEGAVRAGWLGYCSRVYCDDALPPASSPRPPPRRTCLSWSSWGPRCWQSGGATSTSAAGAPAPDGWPRRCWRLQICCCLARRCGTCSRLPLPFQSRCARGRRRWCCSAGWGDAARQAALSAALPGMAPACTLPHISARLHTLPQLLELVREEVKGCTDVPRLHAAAGVFCQLAGGAEPVRSAALRCAALMLANRYPKVRARVWAGAGWRLRRATVRAPHPARAHVSAHCHLLPPLSCRCGGTLRSSCTPLCSRWSRQKRAARAAMRRAVRTWRQRWSWSRPPLGTGRCQRCAQLERRSSACCACRSPCLWAARLAARAARAAPRRHSSRGRRHGRGRPQWMRMPATPHC